jgi:hypothetical protein
VLSSIHVVGNRLLGVAKVREGASRSLLGRPRADGYATALRARTEREIGNHVNPEILRSLEDGSGAMESFRVQDRRRSHRAWACIPCLFVAYS